MQLGEDRDAGGDAECGKKGEAAQPGAVLEHEGAGGGGWLAAQGEREQQAEQRHDADERAECDDGPHPHDNFPFAPDVVVGTC
jgi:hypothetical protein